MPVSIDQHNTRYLFSIVAAYLRALVSRHNHTVEVPALLSLNGVINGVFSLTLEDAAQRQETIYVAVSALHLVNEQPSSYISQLQKLRTTLQLIPRRVRLQTDPLSLRYPLEALPTLLLPTDSPEQIPLVRSVFQQRALHPKIATELFQSGDRPLFYDDTQSSFWGSVPADAGKNICGLLLEELRRQLFEQRLLSQLCAPARFSEAVDERS